VINSSVFENFPNAVSNYNFKIDQVVIEKMVEKFKYPKDYITQ